MFYLGLFHQLLGEICFALPSLIMNFSILPFSSVNFCLIYPQTMLLGRLEFDNIMLY